MRRDRPADLLSDFLEFIDKASGWAIAPEAPADEKTLYAVLHVLQYIGEAASRSCGSHQSCARRAMGENPGMRNLIANDYAGIDAGVVWKTVQERLPELKVAVTALLAELPERNE
ncbi:MAG: DUF86 domain-containing protein [Enhydrobacter sp.]|nr:DUF86 domain-containing protein [Enhydrobacter sp.]